MVYLETCWFGSPELGFETTQLPNPWRCLTHTELGSSGQGSRGSMVPHNPQHPRSVGRLAPHTGIPASSPSLPACFVQSSAFWTLALHRPTAPACSPASASLCASPATLQLRMLNSWLQGTDGLAPPSTEMHSDARCLGLLPLQLVHGPGSHGSTRAWVSGVLTRSFPGGSTSLNTTKRWGSFFPKPGTSQRVKSCWQTHLCASGAAAAGGKTRGEYHGACQQPRAGGGKGWRTEEG